MGPKKSSLSGDLKADFRQRRRSTKPPNSHPIKARPPLPHALQPRPDAAIDERLGDVDWAAIPSRSSRPVGKEATSMQPGALARAAPLSPKRVARCIEGFPTRFEELFLLVPKTGNVQRNDVFP